MTAKDQAPVYRLTEGVWIFKTGDEIRFRKGVWSHKEAVVRLAGQPEPVARFLELAYAALAQGNEADPAVIGTQIGLKADELGPYYELLESLRQQQFLHDTRDKDIARAVRAMLGGNLGGFENYVGTPRPVLFFSDSEYARNAAKALAKETSLPLDVLDDETFQTLASADLTTRVDAVHHTEDIAKLERTVTPYACVLGCVSSPNLTMLRNLNRLLLRTEKPLILGLIDGPFITALSTLAPDTGCFECFEQRMLARLEDTMAYHQFVQASNNGTAPGASWFAPQLHMLTATVISEAYLYSTLGMMRLAGRLVSVYLPLLEIQVQDLLRVPYCPACGFIAKAQMKEMYISSKRIVQEMLDKIEVKG